MMYKDLLQDKFKVLYYYKFFHMTKFYKRFQSIKIQIYDMIFLNQIDNFIEKLYFSKVIIYIKNINSLYHEDIKVIYQLTR